MFSPAFYEQLEDRLNLAVHDINEEHRMFRSVRWSGSGPNSSRSETTGARGITKNAPRVTAEAIARVDSAVSAITATEIKEQPRMSTIGEQFKAARAELLEARQGASSAVADVHDATRVVLTETGKLKQEAADLRAEVAELTNGGPL